VSFALNPALDRDALAAEFRRERRLQIPAFLRHDGALALFRALSESDQWRLAINQGEQVTDWSASERAGWGAPELAAQEDKVIAGARAGFQFRYETIRLPDYGAAVGQQAPPLLAELVSFLSAPPALELLRAVTGEDEVAFVDGHASRYSAGHFLSAHDDSNQGMGRRAAYVLNLTPIWQPDWGGILQFFDDRANVLRGFAPSFNTLNLFAVPQPHSVSWVTPIAAAARYAVTGWLRTS